MEDDRHNSIKARIIKMEEDIDRLKFGDVVRIEERGLMRYHDKVDGLYLFLGRDPQRNGLVEMWFTRGQLRIGRYGFLRTKKYYHKELYQSNATDQNKKDLFSYIDKKLLEAGI